MQLDVGVYWGENLRDAFLIAKFELTPPRLSPPSPWQWNSHPSCYNNQSLALHYIYKEIILGMNISQKTISTDPRKTWIRRARPDLIRVSLQGSTKIHKIEMFDAYQKVIFVQICPLSSSRKQFHQKLQIIRVRPLFSLGVPLNMSLPNVYKLISR